MVEGARDGKLGIAEVPLQVRASQRGRAFSMDPPSLFAEPIVARSEALRQATESGIGAKADEITSSSQDSLAICICAYILCI